MIHLMAQFDYSQLPYSRLKLLYNHDPPYSSVWLSQLPYSRLKLLYNHDPPYGSVWLQSTAL